ncbi:hypothetical protein DH2020_000824 [Rehmannia glutinosa]|uniref:Uncharacterized protein n=1 Tax=Rehmannia glutinosa TaxID=99300 RepID=A0ABR0XXK8_REHGL
MPWICIYIDAACVACSARLLWRPMFSTVFEAKRFGSRVRTKDKLAWVSNLVLMSTTMANFAASLGSMEDHAKLSRFRHSGDYDRGKSEIRMHLVYKGVKQTSSSYKWSIDWILVLQSIGVALGTNAPLLRWEVELPEKTLTNICSEVDKIIEIGKKKRPKNLIEILHKSVNFNGVKEFDINEVESLNSQEPPNNWSLPVVTLTSIAISLPNITDHESNQLWTALSEGLYFAKLIEKSLDRKRDLTIIWHAADVIWVGVELYRIWQDKDLKGRTYKEMLQKLSDIAEKTFRNFTN